MRKILLVVPDGVGVRNFVYSNVIDLLRGKGFQVIVWHAFTDDEVETINSNITGSLEWIRMDFYKETIVERILRVAKIYAQLYWFYKHDSNWIALKTRKAGGTTRAYWANQISQFVGYLCGNRVGVQLLDRWHVLTARRNRYIRSYLEVIDRVQPVFIFCTHQRAPSAVPCLEAGRIRSIVTATFIHSWDNLPKGRMAVRPDYYFVWSEHMRMELMRYYPETPKDRIQVVGSPQFEPYFNKELRLTRSEFLRQIGAREGVPIICYSGCDNYTSPYDQYYLRDIGRALRLFAEESRPMLIFRPVPGDDMKRYGSVLKEFPEIIVTRPIWFKRGSAWKGIIPLRADSRLLVNTILHCDLVINLGSTVSFDFCIDTKPALYIAYNNDQVDTKHWDIGYYYDVPHFRIVKELDPVGWIHSEKEIKSKIEETFSNPTAKLEASQAWKTTLVAHPLEASSERIAEAVDKILI